MGSNCGTCRYWQAEIVDSMTGCAMPEVGLANCRVHLRDTERDDWCNCHSDQCSETEAIERRSLHHGE